VSSYFIVNELIRQIAGKLVDAVADVLHGPVPVVVAAEHHSPEVIDDGAEFFVALAHLLLGTFTVSDVTADALEEPVPFYLNSIGAALDGERASVTTQVNGFNI